MQLWAPYSTSLGLLLQLGGNLLAEWSSNTPSVVFSAMWCTGLASSFFDWTSWIVPFLNAIRVSLIVKRGSCAFLGVWHGDGHFLTWLIFQDNLQASTGVSILIDTSIELRTFTLSEYRRNCRVPKCFLLVVLLDPQRWKWRGVWGPGTLNAPSSILLTPHGIIFYRDGHVQVIPRCWTGDADGEHQQLCVRALSRMGLVSGPHSSSSWLSYSILTSLSIERADRKDGKE